ncbi:kinase-like protein [Clavulina sp. PMI_390]|nr:kinase-like protein [Clavulina sp. PMI_390]
MLSVSDEYSAWARQFPPKEPLTPRLLRSNKSLPTRPYFDALLDKWARASKSHNKPYPMINGHTIPLYELMEVVLDPRNIVEQGYLDDHNDPLFWQRVGAELGLATCDLESANIFREAFDNFIAPTYMCQLTGVPSLYCNSETISILCTAMMERSSQADAQRAQDFFEGLHSLWCDIQPSPQWNGPRQTEAADSTLLDSMVERKLIKALCAGGELSHHLPAIVQLLQNNLDCCDAQLHLAVMSLVPMVRRELCRVQDFASMVEEKERAQWRTQEINLSRLIGTLSLTLSSKAEVRESDCILHSLKLRRNREEVVLLSELTRDPDTKDRSGAFATVIKMTLQNDRVGRLFAVRTLKTTKTEHSWNHRAESLLSSLIHSVLRHPNVSEFCGVLDSDSELHIHCVTKWSTGEDAKYFFVSKPENLTHFLPVMDGFLSGLLYIHKMGIIHGDIHGGNILIEANAHPIIVDFGHSRFAVSERIVDAQTPRHVYHGKYPAPEIESSSDAPLTAQTDLFAAAKTIWTIAQDSHLEKQWSPERYRRFKEFVEPTTPAPGRPMYLHPTHPVPWQRGSVAMLQNRLRSLSSKPAS